MKTMKYINNKLLLLALSGLTMTSCADFLDITPLTMVVEDNYWNEKSDVEQIVIGCYNRMQDNDFMYRLLAWGEMRSDNVTVGFNVSTTSSEYNLLNENLLSTNAYTTWAPFYDVINRCNLVIEKAPQVAENDPSFTQSDVNAIIAEVSGLRALCYFYLVRTFKDVPFYTSAIRSDEQIEPLPATNGDEILQTLAADLESKVAQAVKVYSVESYNYGRITQDAIHAILADIYLWLENYSKVDQHCTAIIESKMEQFEDAGYIVEYPLIPDVGSGGSNGMAYNAIFGTGGSVESIFELDFNDEDVDKANNLVPTFYYKHKDGEASGCLYPTQGLTYEFYTPSAFLKGEDGMVHDSRLYESIRPDDYTTPTASTIVKYVYTSMPKMPVTDPNAYTSGRFLKNGANWIFYRTSEILLMKAEALVNMVNSPDGALTEEDQARFHDAFKLVEAVNARSYLARTSSKISELIESQYQLKENLNTLILEERRREFLFEGKRWFDLVRWSRRTGTTQLLKDKVSVKFTENADVATARLTNMNAIYFPYNYDELKVNSNLKQNPAYSDENSSIETTK